MKTPLKRYASQYESPDAPQDLSYVVKPFALVFLMWVAFWLDQKYMLNWHQFGLFPRTWHGLTGIVASPLLHGSLKHLANNSLPIMALGMGLYYFYPRIAFKVVVSSWLLSGLAVWIIGRSNFHIGASGLVYALAGFLFLSGLLRRQSRLLALSLLVVFIYGSLVWGVLPIEEKISWEGHLTGGIVGLLVALYYRRYSPALAKKYSWEAEVEEEEDYEDWGWRLAEPSEAKEQDLERYKKREESTGPPRIVYVYKKDNEA